MLFKTEVISPNGYLFNNEAYMVVLPTKSGEIAIMSHHTKIITELKSGDIKIYSNNIDLDQKINTSSGFAKITDNTLTITITE
jgi:F-type H+-transporting ATPase subunit epsilon